MHAGACVIRMNRRLISIHPVRKQWADGLSQILPQQESGW